MKGCRSLTDEEIQSVFNQLQGPRNKMLFVLGVKLGLRVSELLSLKLQDVLEHGQVGKFVTVAKKNTKGKLESKTLPLTESAREAIQTYINTVKNKDPNQPLFKSTQSNKPISRMQVHHILKEAFNSLKLTGKLATHSCRKSFAIRVHKALGNDILKTQIALAHKSLNSTSQYLQVDREEVEQAILGLG